VKAARRPGAWRRLKSDRVASRGASEIRLGVTQITMHFHSQHMRRLVAAGLLPERAGQRVRVWAHVPLAELRAMNDGSVLAQEWIGETAVRWALNGKLGGVAVHAGARLAATAGPSAVLTTGYGQGLGRFWHRVRRPRSTAPDGAARPVAAVSPALHWQLDDDVVPASAAIAPSVCSVDGQLMISY
jgi:hypothetical protein